MIELKEIKKAEVGDTLYRHTYTFRRKVELRQSEEVVIVSSTPTLNDDQISEAWGRLDIEDMTNEYEDERDRDEELIGTESFQRRCPYTVDMFSGTSLAGRTR